MAEKMKEKELRTIAEYEMAERLYKIAGESPEAGNALMDVIGEDAYDTVMRLHKIYSTMKTLGLV